MYHQSICLKLKQMNTNLSSSENDQFSIQLHQHMTTMKKSILLFFTSYLMKKLQNKFVKSFDGEFIKGYKCNNPVKLEITKQPFDQGKGQLLIKLSNVYQKLDRILKNLVQIYCSKCNLYDQFIFGIVYCFQSNC
ncbi:unnamed protein product [Paramecium octaurelia]|uniref:Uncharacterized protein n=1 Tax=Paramecium octaurelia TaxID=43137 RepID=A0A8S1SMN9_PAROT|nr:unnamed protein product [Paramecium octaurelia]